MRDERKEYALAQAIAREVRQQGGCAYFVGGIVRDRLLGRVNKDIDIEVFGLTPDALRAVLAGQGQVLEIGAAFGVFRLAHSDLDIAMPRRETCRGAGHRDFDISVDPSLSLKDAAKRRDFTMNAMYQDVLTEAVLDPWDGRRDLDQGVLRHVDDRSFVEDALRAFRAAQFAARFELSIHPDTMALCKRMPVEHLSRERVFAELAKALLQAAKPSVFFRALERMDHLREFFPEIQALIGVEQNPVFHPEGNVFEHTLLVLDAAADLRAQAKQPLFFMLAALCHDLGKIDATVKDPATGKITAHHHPETGIPLAENFLRRLTSQADLKEYVLNMVALHMRPNMLAQHRSRPVKTRLLFDAALVPEDLILLSRADATGKLNQPYDPGLEAFLRTRLEDYRRVMAKPQVGGKDLVAAGFSPGKALGAMLARAHRLHLGGMEKSEVLRQLRAGRFDADLEDAPSGPSN